MNQVHAAFEPRMISNATVRDAAMQVNRCQMHNDKQHHNAGDEGREVGNHTICVTSISPAITFAELLRAIANRFGLRLHAQQLEYDRLLPKTGLAFAFNDMAAPVSNFVSFECLTIDTFCIFRFIAGFRHWPFVAVIRVETVIHVAVELFRSTKPFAGANKDAASKPFWTVVARGSTAIRSDIIVTIGALGSCSYADCNADL